MAVLLRQSVYRRLPGYEDTNAAGRLAVDPAMRQVVGDRATGRQAATTSRMGRFETVILTRKRNLKALVDLSGMWVDRVRERSVLSKLILDMDSSVCETCGRQEGSAYNGHFGCACYHPLYIFNQDGDVERATLRNGSVHSADDWRAMLKSVGKRYSSDDVPEFFRGAAA